VSVESVEGELASRVGVGSVAAPAARSRGRRRLIGVLLAAGVLLGLLVGFNLFKSHMIRQALLKNAAPAQTVSAAPVAYAEWQPALDAVGSLRAVRGVDVTTEVAGLVREIHFRSGEEATAGQVLVELNDSADRAQLNALEAAADLAAVVYGRDRAQFAVQAISKSQIDADEADLKSKRAEVAAQAATVAKKTLRAPFAGRLGITTINPGQYLNPGDKVVTLQRLDPIYVDFRLPQEELSRVARGQTVSVTSDAYPGERFSGKVSAVDPRVDAASRNFQVEALIDNPRHRLVPGMFARVSLSSGGTRRYLTLPQTAISYNPYGATVFLVRKASGSAQAQPTVEQRFVTVGPKRGDQVAVLRGLEEGDTVVTSGQLKLKNGTPIIIDNRVTPANDPHPAPQEE
jgi:membrane fusion protein, multidrug efflux system